MGGGLDERIDRAGIDLSVRRRDVFPTVVFTDEANRSGRLRGDDGVWVCQKSKEHRHRRQGILANHADRPRGVPAGSRVFVRGGLDEIGKRPLGILAELGDVVDHQHAGIFVGCGGERLPQRRERIGRCGPSGVLSSGVLGSGVLGSGVLGSGRLFGFGGRCRGGGYRDGLRCRLCRWLDLRRLDRRNSHRLRRLRLGLRRRGIGTAHQGDPTQDSEPLNRRHAAHRNRLPKKEGQEEKKRER